MYWHERMMIRNKFAKCYEKCLLNAEIAWDNHNLSEADTVISIHHLVDKGMVR